MEDPTWISRRKMMNKGVRKVPAKLVATPETSRKEQKT